MTAWSLQTLIQLCWSTRAWIFDTNRNDKLFCIQIDYLCNKTLLLAIYDFLEWLTVWIRGIERLFKV